LKHASWPLSLYYNNTEEEEEDDTIISLGESPISRKKPNVQNDKTKGNISGSVATTFIHSVSRQSRRFFSPPAVASLLFYFNIK
jgi:hypothetical protein